MTKNEIFQLVENKYGPLTSALKNDWAACSDVLQLKKGFSLVKEEQRCSKMWFIAEGTLRAYYHKDAKRVCDWFAFDQEFICALSSFYADEPSRHEIDLLSDAVLLETSREDIERLCEAHHCFERLGRLSTAESMLGLQEKIVSLQFETAENRLKQLLQKYPDLYLKAPLGDIASYIGITRETLSRLRAKPDSNVI